MVTTNRRTDAFGDHLITVIVLRRFSLWMFILSLNGFLAYFCSPSSKMISTNFDDDGPNISYHTITDDQIVLVDLIITLSRIQCKGHGDKEDDSTICPDK